MADGTAGVLVIGYGSVLRRDDAAGRHVADEIDRRAPAGVTVVTTTQLVPELVEPIAAAERVVFVDASIDHRDVVVRPLGTASASGGSHHATPAELLGLAASLGLRCPPAFVVEVPAFDLSLGDGLSDGTAAAVERAVGEVIALVAAGAAPDRAARRPA